MQLNPSTESSLFVEMNLVVHCSLMVNELTTETEHQETKINKKN